MTENELARAIFGKREGEGSTQRVTVVSGTAVEDSADGSVKVDLGGEVISPSIIVDEDTGEVVVAPPQQAVEVPTTGGIKEGDAVTVIVDDGIPTGASGTGSVDRVADLAESASTTAQEAAAVAAAVGQHFWHNDNGAHVTEETRESYEQQPSGFQQLMASIGTLLTRAVNGIEYLLRSDTQSGMAIYDGTCTADDANLPQHMVASFTAQGAQIGKSDSGHIGVSSNGMGVFDGDGAQYGYFGDMRGATGTFTVTMPTETAAVYTETYDLPYAAATDQSTGVPVSMTVKQNNVVLPYGTRYTYQATPSPRLLFTPALEIRRGLQVTYESDDDRAKTFLFGAGAETTGVGAVAVGTDAKAQAANAHAFGLGAVAASEDQRVAGKYNIVDQLGTYADIIGCGTSNDTNDRANLYTLRWNGTAWYKNNGNPYCKQGTSVKCAGQTIGSSDNLSYVLSTDTLRAPTRVKPPLGAGTNSSFVYYWRIGRLVIGNGTFNLTTTAVNAVIATGLPAPNLSGAQPFDFVRTSMLKIGAGQSEQAEVHVTSDGRLTSNGTSTTGWFVVNFAYVTAS